jgi:hypothetical protein
MRRIEEAICVEKVDKYDGQEYVPEEFVDKDMQYICIDLCNEYDINSLNNQLLENKLEIIKVLELLYTNIVKNAEGKLYAVQIVEGDINGR